MRKESETSGEMPDRCKGCLHEEEEFAGKTLDHFVCSTEYLGVPREMFRGRCSVSCS